MGYGLIIVFGYFFEVLGKHSLIIPFKHYYLCSVNASFIQMLPCESFGGER